MNDGVDLKLVHHIAHQSGIADLASAQHVEPPALLIIGRADDGWLVLSVEDDGPGIPLERDLAVAVDRLDESERSASFLTSRATTVKPAPASPARAASIAAFNASRLV